MWYDEVGYKSINAGKRMKELDKPDAGLRWFWEPVEGSGLRGLIYTGYSTMTHAMIRALCERWHTETSSFHVPVGEMTITLDDVHNLLHIPIHGCNTPFSQHKNFFKKNSMHQSKHINRASHILKHLLLMIK